MIAKLNTARMAIQEANWTLVNQILQQLPIEKNGTTPPALNPSEWDDLLDLAIEILLKSDFQQRWEIAKLFPKLGNSAIAPLIELLEDQTIDLEIRWFAGRILSQFHDPSCVIALSKLLQQTEDEDLSSMAAQALAEIGTPAIAALADLLQITETRLLATQALSQIRRSETISPLLTIVEDPDPDVRATAIEALGSFHEPRIYPILVKATQDRVTQVRKEAIIALGYLTEAWAQESITHLTPFLYDLKPEICQQAVIALGRIGTPQATEVMLPVLKSPATPTWLKLEIVRTLGWIASANALEYLQEALRWNDESICQEIIVVLGRQKDPQLKKQATQILIEFYRSQQQALHNPSVRQSLAVSFGELGEPEGSELLTSLAQDSDLKVRLHAIAALKKLSKQSYPILSNYNLS